MDSRVNICFGGVTDWQEDSACRFSDTVVVTAYAFPEVERHPNVKTDVYLWYYILHWL